LQSILDSAKVLEFWEKEFRMAQRKKDQQAGTISPFTEPSQRPITTMGLEQCKILEN
jgi:hypothetical protein